MANFKVPHLCRRGNVFYFRMAIPPSLRARIGALEVKLSLKTSDPAAARLRCRRFSSGVVQLISRVAAMPELSQEAIHTLLRRFFEEELALASEIAELAPQDDKFDFEGEIEGARADEAAIRKRIGRREFTEYELVQARALAAQAGVQPGELDK